MIRNLILASVAAMGSLIQVDDVVAQTTVVTPPPAIAPPAAPAAPPAPALVSTTRKAPVASQDVSAFVKCDGSKGHAGFLEKLGQVVAITATAGLSGAVTNDYGAVKDRLSAKEGVAACNAAIASEGNEGRRLQLGVARTVHELEAKDLDAALASVRQLPSLAGAMANDPGYVQSYGASIAILEADILMRMGRVQEAEDIALRSSADAPYELLAGARASRFLNATGTLSPAKRAYFDRMARLMPETLVQYSRQLAWAGDYRGAAGRLDDFQHVILAFAPDARPELPKVTNSVYLAMAGDMTASNALADEVTKSIALFAATPEAAKDASFIATVDEYLAFQRIARLLAEGNAAKARVAFGARDRWSFVPTPVVADITGRLRAGASAGDLVGPLERDPTTIRKDALGVYVTALSADKNSVTRLYGSLGTLMKASTLSAAGGSAWKIGDKPRYLVKRAADSTARYDTISVYPIFGLEAGQVVLLHSALIARAHGKQGFVLLPFRRSMTTSGVLFVDRGEAGLPDAAMFDAATVIADLSRAIPDPATLPRR